ncbi:MAG: AMP-binding protein, partial [Myxococcales bacterium]|nr:AMP-binding protein [Myxococcales bacterium]
MAPLAEDKVKRAETIPELIQDSIRLRDVDHYALIADGGQGKRISYVDLGKRIGSLAGGLRSLGVGKQDCVALLSENRPEW